MESTDKLPIETALIQAFVRNNPESEIWGDWHECTLENINWRLKKLFKFECIAADVISPGHYDRYIDYKVGDCWYSVLICSNVSI